MTVAPGLDESSATSGEVVGSAADIRGRSPGQIVWGRLRKDKVSLTALVVAALFLLAAVLAPILTAAGLLHPNDYHIDLVQGLGSMPVGFGGGISATHPLGVEPGTGRDLLARIMSGLTVSFTVAISATILSLVAGTALGLIAGFVGGRIDWLISRFLDLVMSFPSTLMLLSLQAVLVDRIAKLIGQPNTAAATKIIFMVIVLGFFSVPQFARVIRGQVLSLRNREFIEAARSLGARQGRIYIKELLPHLWPPLLVYTTLLMPANIAAEAALGFLGVGINPPTASLGAILNDTVNFVIPDPAYFVIPGLAVVILVLSINLFGDGLRDALDPRSGRR